MAGWLQQEPAEAAAGSPTTNNLQYRAHQAVAPMMSLCVRCGFITLLTSSTPAARSPPSAVLR